MAQVPRRDFRPEAKQWFCCEGWIGEIRDSGSFSGSVTHGLGASDETIFDMVARSLQRPGQRQLAGRCSWFAAFWHGLSDPTPEARTCDRRVTRFVDFSFSDRMPDHSTLGASARS